MVGHHVSHANNKTKRRFLPNLQRRRFWVETENRWVSLRLTNAALRTIDKNGIDVVLAAMRARMARVVAEGGGIQAVIDATGLSSLDNVTRLIDPAILKQAYDNDLLEQSKRPPA